ncbi:MAG: ATP-binding protein [Thermovenabulum sp.]
MAKYPSFVILYGRRRVGKTSLIKEFIKNKPAVYFLATEEIEEENMKNFQREITAYFNLELFKEVFLKSWEKIFQLIPETKEKLVIVIDEFQYLAFTNKAIPSIFQKIWDEILNKKNIMLILCGSYVSMMENLTLSYSSPLFGRRTAQIKLSPLNFFEAKLLYNEEDNEKNILLYSITGGVPKYIEMFDFKNLDLFSAISENVLKKGSFLYEEAEFLLEKEVEKNITYFSILNITKYLDTLQKLDILERVVPITEENPEKSKKGLYFIKDNFLNFWFKFVFPYKSYLEIEKVDYVLKKIQERFFENHVSFAFKDICRQFLLFKFPFILPKIGKWWDSDEEIDIVGINPEEKICLFGECKFNNNPLSLELFFKLKEKAKKVKINGKNNENYKIHYSLFSKSGFSKEFIEYAKENKNIYLFTLEDIK